MREVVDRLSGLLGFTMRVTERGGTQLAGLLSNKNLWSGTKCGRGECRPCQQTEEQLENCKRRNILYESECQRCNGPEGEQDMEVNDKREQPSIYVGESCRSLCERSSEHWADAKAKKDTSHMIDHHLKEHGGEGEISFKFRVVKSFRSSLDRQVAEAIRIYRRGLVLNRKGEYNRCGLTRMVLDDRWEQEKWEKSWEEGESIDVNEGGGEGWVQSKKTKLNSQENDAKCKRRKVEHEEGFFGGETVGISTVKERNL